MQFSHKDAGHTIIWEPNFDDLIRVTGPSVNVFLLHGWLNKSFIPLKRKRKEIKSIFTRHGYVFTSGSLIIQN